MLTEAAGPSPLRILLVSDDHEFAARVVEGALDRGVEIACVGPADDLEIAAFRHGVNVVVLDADAAPRGRTRAATAFASAHPAVTVVLAATSSAVARGGLPLVEKKSAEELLRDVDRARRGHSYSAFNF